MTGMGYFHCNKFRRRTSNRTRARGANLYQHRPTSTLTSPRIFRCERVSKNSMVEQRGSLSQDPLGFVDGPNLFPYVTGNPVDLGDPSGLETCPPHPDGVKLNPPIRPDEPVEVLKPPIQDLKEIPPKPAGFECNCEDAILIASRAYNLRKADHLCLEIRVPTLNAAGDEWLWTTWSIELQGKQYQA